MRPYKQLNFLLSFASVLTMITLGSVPFVWQLGTSLEGEYFPVVVPIRNESGEPLPIVWKESPGMTDGGVLYVDIWVQFDKIRSCKFTLDERYEDDPSVDHAASLRSSLSWYDIGNRRLRIMFEKERSFQPATRPRGHQSAGPWRIFGVDTSADTRAIVAHNCHPFWTTYTNFFP